jgi:lysine 6-dehydrogenase
MKILLLGVGLQGKAALYDMVNSPEVNQVIAVDREHDALINFVKGLNTTKVEPVACDVDDESQVSKLMKSVEAVVVLLPTSYNLPMARLAVENGIHFVNSSYKPNGLAELGPLAAEKGIAILPEFGLDPGIDLVLGGQAVRELDRVDYFYSYGSGVPAPDAAGNPLGYKISWSFHGVLNAYKRPARYVNNGEVIEVSGGEIFSSGNVHTIDVPGWGMMEAYLNGDVVGFLDELEIRSTVKNAGRFATRWPGHCAFWYPISQLGFLSDDPVQIGDVRVSPKEFVCSLLEPQLQYSENERDLALILVDVRGEKDGKPMRILYTASGLRDLDTGFMAMTRMVGFTSSIGAQMILRGDIEKRGLLSPLTDIPFDIFTKELEKRGINIERTHEMM